MQQHAQIDSVAALAILVGQQQQRIDELEATIQKMRDWGTEINRWRREEVDERLPKKRSYTPPDSTIKAEDVERAYRIVRKGTGRNYQADSDYGRKCRQLMAKHGVDKVCQVLAYACRCNNEKGSSEWSRPATLFRPANFSRWADEMEASRG